MVSRRIIMYVSACRDVIGFIVGADIADNVVGTHRGALLSQEKFNT